MKNIKSNNLFKTELIGIEQNHDTLKLTFKTTIDEPLIFKFNSNVIVITETYEIYEVALQVFPVISLKYFIKNVGTGDNITPLDEYIIDIDTLGFGDYNEFKQFIMKYPVYVRYLEFIYRILNMRPYLFLLYTARISYRHNIRVSNDETEITIGKTDISTIIKKFELRGKTTLKLVNKNGRVLFLSSVIDTPIADFDSLIKYDELVQILKERPNAILNTLILLILTLLF
jgi:hypothetical protein